MSGYTKVFSDIVDSSIWAENSDICKVWVTLLALSDQNGFVRGSIGWLAGKSKVRPAICKTALEKFESPDPESRTPDNEGRRIETLPDGWLILNYLLFRDRLSDNPQAIATRERVRRHREKHQSRYTPLRNAESVTCPVSVSASASELLNGCKIEEAIAHGKTLVPPMLAENVHEWWTDRDGVGWLNPRGLPIKKWKSDQSSWWIKYRHNEQQRAALRRNGNGKPHENPYQGRKV